jgi:hypothetical protein
MSPMIISTPSEENLGPSQKTILFLKMFARTYRVLQFTDNSCDHVALC